MKIQIIACLLYTSIIGANSTVTKSIPEYSVAVGSPAKVIKTFNRMENRSETEIYKN